MHFCVAPKLLKPSAPHRKPTNESLGQNLIFPIPWKLRKVFGYIACRAQRHLLLPFEKTVVSYCGAGDECNNASKF